MRLLHARHDHGHLRSASPELRPSQAEIGTALLGNICRCGEYPKIYDAVLRAAAELRTEAAARAMA